MSYKLGLRNQVQHIDSRAWIPARFENGEVVLLDEHSPGAAAFAAWVNAGNAPEPADKPDPNEQIDAEIRALEAQVTPRMLRDAVLRGDQARVRTLDEAIEVLRAQRTRA